MWVRRMTSERNCLRESRLLTLHHSFSALLQGLADRWTCRSQILRIHHWPKCNLCVKCEKPRLGDGRNLRSVLHVEHNGTRPLDIVIREEICRFRFEIGQDSLTGRS